VESLSTRAIQIDKYYEEHKAELHAKYPNADVGEIKQTITNMTRQDKVSMTKEQIDARYTKEINSAGLNKEDIALGVHRAAEAAQEAARDNIKMNQYELIRTAANGLVSGEGRFSAQDLLKTAADLSRGDVSLPRLQEAVEALSKDKEIIKQADSYTMRGRGNRTYNDQSFTTPEVLRAEKYIMDYATDSQGKAAPVTTQEKAQEAIKQYEQQQRAGQQKQGKESDFKFTDGQKQVIEHIASNSHGVIDIEGSAGAGKTRALDAVREIAEKAGWEVKGFAPSGKAAEELEKSAGIVSRTVDKFLIDQVKLARGTEKLDAIKTNYKEQLDKAVTFDRLTSCFTYELKTELNTIRAKDRVLATMPEQPTGKPQLWIVDEKSMLGSVKMAELMQWAGKADAKVVFTGDTRQMQSIEAGNMFKKMQEAGAVQTVRMNENIRQRDNPEYRQAMQDLSNKKIDKAMDRLDSNGKISEIADRGERLQAIKEDYLSRNYKNTVIVTDRNDDRNEINKSIREGLKEQGKLKGEDRTFTVRESKNLDGTGKLKAENYQAGDIIKGHNLKGITNGQEVAVKSADPGSHTLTVVDREGKEHSIDTRRDGDRITNVYQENDRGFCKGEKIVFLRNDEGLGVKNGNVAIIKSMDDKGNITVKMESGRELKFNPQTQYNYITAGFAVSVYKSEGGTWQNALVHADSKKDTTFNSQYVAQSRGKQDIQIYTDNKAELREQMKTEQHKTSTLDFVKTEIGKEQGGPEAEKAEGPEQKSENGQQGKSAANETAAEKSGKIETEQGKTDKGYLEVCENTKETAEQQTEAKQEEHDKKETHEFETEQQTGKETEHVEVEHNSKHEEDEAYDHSHGHEAAAEHSEYETDRETEHGAGVEHEAEEAQEQEREIDFD